MSLLPRGRGRRDLLVSISPSIPEFPDFCNPNSRGLGTARGTRSHARVACEDPSPTVRRGTPLCRARAPALDPFGCRRTRTTVFYRIQARRGTGPRPTVRWSVFSRSAGACPPRTLVPLCRARAPALAVRVQAHPNYGLFQGLGPARGTRSHARVACEGPRPTVRWSVFLP